MIKNQFEYNLTQEKLKDFKEALDELLKQKQDFDDLEFELYFNAYKSQIEELETEIKQYEALLNNKEKYLKIESIEDLPNALVKARIMKGYSEEQLAKELGIDRETYLRAERNDFENFDSTTLLRLIDILGIKLTEEVEALIQLQYEDLESKLTNAGFDLSFFKKKLSYSDFNEYSVIGTASFVERLLKIFQVSIKDILGNMQLGFNLTALNTRFKLPANANKKNIGFYTAYANYIGQIALKATSHLKSKSIPDNPKVFYFEVINRYGELTFENVLRYSWDLGVCVLPLNDKGAFHGAFWRVNGRNLIILKQRIKYESRWLFDLLHELWHAIQEPDLKERTVIDYEDAEQVMQYNEEERIANKFAGNIILSGQAEKLVQLCVEKSHGKVEFLKSAVQAVAKEKNVPLGGLANYMAYKLSVQGINWWGTAANLQTGDTNPLEISREIFLENANLEVLSENERYLLLSALYGEE
ncbi:hypothetical protein CN643_15905 [Parageobacillus yumthangensis]|nr:hypothetical protein CN643_15905 [Parageobacillus yumthangensis]TXK91147.1 helix-turn-helix domain-containing protein [Parageobacillus sp. SY1]